MQLRGMVGVLRACKGPALLDCARHGLRCPLWPLLQVCSAFSAEYAKYGHVKMHHGYTNVLGLGDSSTWRLPCLNRYVYMFLAPLLIPIITPLVAVGEYARAVPWHDLLPRFPYFPSWLPGGLRQPCRVEGPWTQGQVWLCHLLTG